jgi:3-methyladenine DNA glycosylase AlkD
MAKAESRESSHRAREREAAPEQRADEIVALLKQMGTKAVRDGMARFAIPSEHAFGVSVGALKRLSIRYGKDQSLANALWQTSWYEARILAPMVGDPVDVTPALMDRWCRDFDNWAICDHACFHLFDRTPHAFAKVRLWARKRHEFQKRAAFALLWGLTVHDKTSAPQTFIDCLPIVETAATDERNFVKKAVNMALRAIGKRNQTLHVAALALAEQLASSSDPTARWVGKDALKELSGPKLMKRLDARQ